ncbi:amino acid adenylation domain-containing protein [Colletotrichum plurivorum]|uniref:Amino acid adenylation domain-containing protein n=1 Tax=Colletotrichum plurivorum TaxID=2175906 RepID=A0A8H6KQG7_9PEZI|nr:amino acid adenylation domain-containing protein [Colletotrichum plurivorum]
MSVQLVNLADNFPCYTTSEGEAQFIYKEIFVDRCYDGPKLSETPFVIDAGANVGMFSIYIKQKYPAAKILAFEPAPDTFDVMRQNLKLHNVAEGVEMHPYGLGPKASTEKLTYFPNLPGNSTLRPEEKEAVRKGVAESLGQEFADATFGNAQQLDVKIERLSHFLQSYPDVDRIDLLKVDVEGVELGVLQGLDDEHWAKVRNVVLETMEQSGDRAAIEELLKSKGLTVTLEEAAWAPGANGVYMMTASRD